jgi:hypothetical protein
MGRARACVCVPVPFPKAWQKRNTQNGHIPNATDGPNSIQFISCKKNHEWVQAVTL